MMLVYLEILLVVYTCYIPISQRYVAHTQPHCNPSVLKCSGGVARTRV